MANYPPMNYQQPMYYPQQFYPNIQQPTQMPVQPVQSVPTQGNVVTPPVSQPGLVCCSVTSKAEAEAQRVEAFGPGVLMADFGHGMVYYKRFNNDTALADFVEFKIVPPETEGGTNEPSATSTLDVAALVGAFTNRFDAMDEKMDAIAKQLKSKPTASKTSASKGGAKR